MKSCKYCRRLYNPELGHGCPAGAVGNRKPGTKRFIGFFSGIEISDTTDKDTLLDVIECLLEEISETKDQQIHDLAFILRDI